MAVSRWGAPKRDERPERRANLMLDRIVATGSLVLREAGDTRNLEMAAHRHLSSQQVDVDGFPAPHGVRTARAVQGRRIVAAQDTTEINVAGRKAPRKGLGSAGNDTAKGFFIHSVLAIDAEGKADPGIAGAKIWTRDEASTPPHQGRPFEEQGEPASARRRRDCQRASGCRRRPGRHGR